jgi:hypothetical protein
MSPRDRERLLTTAIRDLDAIVDDHLQPALRGDHEREAIVALALEIRAELATLRSSAHNNN